MGFFIFLMISNRKNKRIAAGGMFSYYSHHAEGLVNPKVNTLLKGY
jgi:hypothetical protein